LKDQVAILGKAIEIQDHDEGNRFQEMVVKHERMLNDQAKEIERLKLDRDEASNSKKVVTNDIDSQSPNGLRM
jgi:hypothetical protein